MMEFGLLDHYTQTKKEEKKPALVNNNRKSYPSNPNLTFRFGVEQPPQGKREKERDKSYENMQSIKLGAQGFPDTEYQPTLMDNEEGNVYKMDMNMFPELISEYNVAAQSELPERKSEFKSSKIYIQPSTPVRIPKKNDIIRDDVTHGITIESILDPNFGNDKCSYFLTFKIKY